MEGRDGADAKLTQEDVLSLFLDLILTYMEYTYALFYCGDLSRTFIGSRGPVMSRMSGQFTISPKGISLGSGGQAERRFEHESETLSQDYLTIDLISVDDPR